ncbi:MAG: polymerase, sigma-24 subunit, subfamily [Polaromonas sp.]|nr:polymerase, sigma-24 subunit, subfamily [Polaromonas sp.]
MQTGNEFAAQQDAELTCLMVRVAAQDEAALAALYRRMSRMIYAFSMRRLGDADVAEEVVVETMYEVWKGAARFGGRSLVTTWILGIARHKALDKLRAGGMLPFEAIDDEAEAVADALPSAYDLIASRQRAGQVALCMEALPDAQRECVHMAFYEDAPLAEIAVLQECPENTVKTRLFHARRKMRDCLERQVSRTQVAL